MTCSRGPERRGGGLSRRQWLISTGIVTVGAAMPRSATEARAQRPAAPPQLRFCLNTATIRGQNLPVDREIEIAAQAGYDGIEPWTGRMARFVEGGGRLKELRKRIADLGLTVESAIGFPTWIVNDPQQRAKGIEAMKRDMDLVRQIGGRRIAAPPAGAHRGGRVALADAAERYRQILELGDQMGVTPQLEIWGSSPVLSRLGQALFVMAESGHPKACLLPDVFHMYKSGAGLTGLRLIGGTAMHVFHMNDYPAAPPREAIRDSGRIYPGDGIAPLTDIVRTVVANGFQGTFSLELFNRDLWKQDPLEVARMGLRKMRQVVQKALG